MFTLEVCNLYFLILDYWLLRGLAHDNGLKIPFVLLARLLAPDYTGARRQFDLSHLTSTEEASAGSSYQLALSTSAKWHGLLTASKAFHG